MITIVIGTLGTITKRLLQGLDDLEIRRRVETIQTIALLRSAWILGRVLETCCLSDSNEKNHQLTFYSQKSKIIIMITKRHIPKLHRTKTNTGRRNEFWKLKENYFRKEDLITIVKKAILDNSQGRNWKNEQFIHIYLNGKYYEIKRIILNRSISLWKNRCSPKEHEKKTKTWSGNSTRDADKKSITTSKNEKKEKHWNLFKQIEKKAAQVKQTIKLE